MQLNRFTKGHFSWFEGKRLQTRASFNGVRQWIFKAMCSQMLHENIAKNSAMK